MARKGALATEPLRGQARKDFQASLQNGQAASQVQNTGHPQAILHGQARKNYQAAAQAAQAAGEAPPSQQQYMPKIRTKPMPRPQQVGQNLAGAVGNGANVGTLIGNLPSGQTPIDVGQAVVGNFNSSTGQQPGAWWQGQQLGQMGHINNIDPGFNAQMGQFQNQMPQPSANHGGQYRLSPGVYGTQQQAMQQWNQQMGQLAMPIIRKY